ncbi:putative ATP-grasp-modified RiPP [Streptosporangium sp. NPDC006007]|uniref:putative ATP-grasp-modified RiPP n=1 Tax=Streptosporangium sp. NPDC006007 TaxID=3154575 RepID=UPI0033B68BD6
MDESVSLLRPWGATRLAPFQGLVGIGYADLELDPETQTTLYFDEAGQPIEMGKHGTNQAVTSSKATGGGDGTTPTPPDDVAITEYVPD